MSVQKIKIGYLCSRGHYCFDADPEEGGQCGSKSVGDIYVEVNDDWPNTPESYVVDADNSLSEVIETWRRS